MSGFIQSTIEGFIQDAAIDYGNEYAGEHFQPTKDPFYEELINPKTGEKEQIKRKLPEGYFTKQETKDWKKIRDKAWIHDRSICGCCCWTDFVGWAPIVSILPIIGPALMYSVHKKLIQLADKKFHLSAELKVKMYSNIGVDLAISLIPILGSIFSWMNACSTRNAAMIYNFIVQRAMEQRKRQEVQEHAQNQTRQSPSQPPPLTSSQNSRRPQVRNNRDAEHMQKERRRQDQERFQGSQHRNENQRRTQQGQPNTRRYEQDRPNPISHDQDQQFLDEQARELQRYEQEMHDRQLQQQLQHQHQQQQQQLHQQQQFQEQQQYQMHQMQAQQRNQPPYPVNQPPYPVSQNYYHNSNNNQQYSTR
ncbi:hypothetical protein Kpol_1025p29 [Vanderwaltozyma polyspora DSM 70294]|uniref:Uncharacterized protein n=1 Tax=Vanderwaltozyma polyspora (strain ATCC 22028 / DSM 70294 / BCRC 21397 / CBS 2163 / NBRC 10782 / NRRL Y-8283 / UCD 57-17) TaxID=436907 RepID=A7TKV4_VANPO|nr:uncharacterized protein Kpol_1025p29 [Vanderwaltozyma polyspora DSM 70294]EDO17109.1 hypothetical protein Kpol_1025p29 [Vanderwaltozyma polyspora DSM 70294]